MLFFLKRFIANKVNTIISQQEQSHYNIYTHTHIYIYIYIYICQVTQLYIFTSIPQLGKYKHTCISKHANQ
jgi:hypothetical protein